MNQTQVESSIEVDRAVELEIEWRKEQERQAEAHRFHWDSKGWCVWCLRGRAG